MKIEELSVGEPWNFVDARGVRNRLRVGFIRNINLDNKTCKVFKVIDIFVHNGENVEYLILSNRHNTQTEVYNAYRCNYSETSNSLLDDNLDFILICSRGLVI